MKIKGLTLPQPRPFWRQFTGNSPSGGPKLPAHTQHSLYDTWDIYIMCNVCQYRPMWTVFLYIFLHVFTYMTTMDNIIMYMHVVTDTGIYIRIGPLSLPGLRQTDGRTDGRTHQQTQAIHPLHTACFAHEKQSNRKLSYRRGAALRAMAIEILSSDAQL